jgi:hypothetical protein
MKRIRGDSQHSAAGMSIWFSFVFLLLVFALFPVLTNSAEFVDQQALLR